MQEIKHNHQTDRQYNSIDLFKFVMAFAVVALHTNPFSGCKNGVFLGIFSIFLNLAVPFFFLSSGYLLAVKMEYPYGSGSDQYRIKRQLGIILRMYLIWTAIYAPLAVLYYASTGWPVHLWLLSYLQKFLFVGEQFNSWHLWYLLSTVYALIVIGLVLRKKRSSGALVVISVTASVLYIVFEEIIQYKGEPTPILGFAQELINRTFIGGRTLSGMVYIPVGMLLARKKIPNRINWLVFILGFILDYHIPNSVVSHYLRIITAIAFFGIVEHIDLKNRPIYAKLRNMSTVIYLIHMYVWTFYYQIVYGQKTYGMDSFVVTSCASIAIAAAYGAARKKMRNR